MKHRTTLSERQAIEAARRALEVYVEGTVIRPKITGEAVWSSLSDSTKAIGVHVLSGDPIPRGYVVLNYKAQQAIVFNALNEPFVTVTWREAEQLK